MKAIVLTQPGPAQNLQLQEIDPPTPGPQEVLVRVKAISLNPVDNKTRDGKAFFSAVKDEGEPMVMGWDISGEVAALGVGVTSFKKGDGVFGMVRFPGNGRAYAEYVAAPADHLALKPSSVSHEQAAGATLAALTAWQVLVQQANVQPGQRVLIHAAAGGVGHYAVQIAKHLGAYVIGTASGANADFLRELGVDAHINYENQKLEEEAQDVDMVLDSLGEENSLRSLACMRAGGTLVSILGGAKESVLAKARDRQITAKNYLVHASGEDQTALATLLEKGILQSHVSYTFPLAEMAAAHQQVETRKTKGKVVVTID